MEDAVAEAYAADLGVPVARWHVTERLHILRYDTGDRNDVATYVTLGLSALVVTQELGVIRQELIFECYRRFAREHWVSALTYFAGMVALDGAALPAFQVVEMDVTLSRVAGVEAMLCYSPLYHPPLHVIDRTEPPTVVVWLLPLRKAEAELARRDGWEPLVTLFEERQPDFLDLRRRSVV
jgi:hypothetical protein